jgi:hypothetical protein
MLAQHHGSDVATPTPRPAAAAVGQFDEFV